MFTSILQLIFLNNQKSNQSNFFFNVISVTKKIHNRNDKKNGNLTVN